jgi:hypothetical protein
MAKFFGPYEVVSDEVVGKLESGQEIVEVKFKDKTQVYLTTRKGFDETVSETHKDFNRLREDRYQALLARMATECLESGVAYEDIGYVAKRLGDNLLHSFEAAACKAMGAEHIPGMDPFTSMTLVNAHAILTGKGAGKSASKGA